MAKKSRKETPIRLLTSVPNKDYSRLVVRYPYQTNDQYAHAYHFSALDLQEEFPKSVEAMVSKLHEADKAGTAFRYAGLLPDTQEYADFPNLVEMLDREFSMLYVVTDYAEGCYDPMPTLSEMVGDYS